MKHTIPIIAVFLLAALPTVPRAAAATKPVRVFILAGQSNMEGAGQIRAETYYLIGEAMGEGMTTGPRMARISGCSPRSTGRRLKLSSPASGGSFT